MDTRPARPDAGHVDLCRHGFELRRVPALPGRSHDRHGFWALLDGQTQLGGEPAARASQPAPARDHGARQRHRPVGSVYMSPCLRAPAACWSGRHTVESALRYRAIAPLVSARDWNPVRTCCQVPYRCHRRNKSQDRPPVRTRRGRSAAEARCVPGIVCRRSTAAGPDVRPLRLRALRQQRLQHRPLFIREISPPHEPRSFTLKIHSVHGPA